jgi:hypothetical protein
MKTLTKSPLLILLLFMMLAGCKTTKSLESKLNGQWELRHVKGIQVANVDPNFPKGNGYILKFDNGKLEKYAKGKLEESDDYTVKEEKARINNSEVKYSIFFKKANSTKHFNISDQKLVIFDGELAADGTESAYEKL